MWQPIETVPRGRKIEFWHSYHKLVMPGVLTTLYFSWGIFVVICQCVSKSLPITEFSHWREPSQGPDAKPDTYDTGLDFWIEKRAGIDVLCGKDEDGTEWCSSANQYEVALWEKLQELLKQIGPDGKSNFWG